MDDSFFAEPAMGYAHEIEDTHFGDVNGMFIKMVIIHILDISGQFPGFLI